MFGRVVDRLLDGQQQVAAERQVKRHGGHSRLHVQRAPDERRLQKRLGMTAQERGEFLQRVARGLMAQRISSIARSASRASSEIRSSCARVREPVGSWCYATSP